MVSLLVQQVSRERRTRIRTRKTIFPNFGNDHERAFRYINEHAPHLRTPIPEKIFRRTFEFARDIHDGQKRKDGKRDALTHPLEVTAAVAIILQGMVRPASSAVIHDTGEDGSKNGNPVTYEMIRQKFGERAAKDLALLTVPKCKRPKEPNGKVKHEWVFFEDPAYAETRDFYKADGGSYPIEVYIEMREVYFRRLHTKNGVIVLPIKLVDALNNLFDIDNLPDAKQRRKLEETCRLLVQSAVRLDWTLYEIMVGELIEWQVRRPEWGLEIPEFDDVIGQQREKGVILCRSRANLDLEMIQQELVIRYPGSPEIAVYGTVEGLWRDGTIELGLPTEGTEHYRRRSIEALVRRSKGLSGNGVEVRYGRSLFSRLYGNLGARERIYAVSGLRNSTLEKTEHNFERFVDELRAVQLQLARNIGQIAGHA